jgi:hypothetical protein
LGLVLRCRPGSPARRARQPSIDERQLDQRKLTSVKRFIAASISLKRISESQVALTVSAAMSANASSSLPAMLRYHGRRAVAVVGVAGVVIRGLASLS